MSFSKAFLGGWYARVPGAVSSSRSTCAAAWWGFAGNFPMCEAHAAALCGGWCNGLGGMVLATSRQGRLGASKGGRGSVAVQTVGAASRWKHCPDFSMACMMTASLRATATAARLKPILWRSFNPQVLSALSALVRVRTTVAAS